ncbi:hypothetical protein ABB37_01542 [Leptomonas pyrrhocoris]|uniref:WW domain-containing protein n=1 Tax=Leptomonas pyrrhocoris TaxID=157538 RepID=A0A0M9G989_LEPPY|nr:hypothetical protein ABB37_01542 [Leptomonas pyrrhocoris]KPA85169.1 hypothetical protein ABB37_01542 [Leptomonas pyrrhocoris]|eukprot:XP_015663608.1 hypothetical protein ABB37_01542 [Leptomonas pyrrhocoris]
MPPVKTVKNDTDVIIPKAGEEYVSEDGTVSQVLDDHVDANYEPTEEEVLEFADWIGMHLPEDAEYLWLAREGLKTPLPKEWKPCSTNDGEVYYFNFKTGESSWDHPMDSLFRQRFEQEKGKALKKGKTAPATSSGKTTITTGNLDRGGSGLGLSSPAGGIPQTRVIMTEAGTTTRGTGLAAGSPLTPTPTPAASGLSTGSRNATEKGAKSGKPAKQTASPHLQQGTSATATATTLNDRQNSASVSSAASPLTGSTGSVGFGSGSGGNPVRKGGPQPAVSSSTSTPAPAASLSAPRRTVSEAERAMEEKVQREVQRAFEAEKAKLAEAHQSSLASLQQLQEKDVAEMRAADAARRAATTKQEDEERERRLQQTRAKCEELYGDELRTMEREEETLQSKLQRMEAEAARAASGNTQRTQIEEQMQNELARHRTDLEATMKRQHDAAMAAEETAHTAAMQKIAREGQEKVQALQQASLHKMDAAERAMALDVDAQKRKLEYQLKDLERQLAEKAKANCVASGSPNAASDAAATAPSPSLSEELTRITAAKAAQLHDLETEAEKEREAVRIKSEAALSEMTRQQQQPQPLSPSGLQSSMTNRVPSFSGDRPMSVVVQGGSFSGSRTTSSAFGVTYLQELNRIRMTRAKERQERLAQLLIERNAAIAAVSVSSVPSLGASGHVGSSTRSDADALASPTLEELKTTHAAELEAKKALYAHLEAELKAQLAQETAMAAAATTAEQQSAVVAKAVEAEMELYVQEVQARHARMQLEASAKREKLLSDHQLALEAYERRKKEMEMRQAREEQEAKEAFIQEKVHAAAKAERANLEAKHATSMARLAARYEEERGAAKAEVDEEMDAYERAEKQKMMATAAAAVASAQRLAQQKASLSSASASLPQRSNADTAAAAAATATAAIETRCAQLSQQLADKEARWAADTAKREAERNALAAKRATLQARQREREQHLRDIKDQNIRLAASLSAAEAQRDSARRSASAATPSPLSPAAASPDVPPNGYRLRTAHEAALRSMEDGYRAEQSALEADLQSWRSKTQLLVQNQHRRPSLGGLFNPGLNTPRQQVFSTTDSVARTPMFSHPSPIAPTAAGASLQNTPYHSFPFGESPWVQPRSQQSQQPQRSTTPPLSSAGVPSNGGGLPLSAGGGSAAPSVARSLMAPASPDALSYYGEHPQEMQQRQAALMAAREAWQQQRARQLQQFQVQQLQRSLSLPPSPSATASFSRPGGGYDSYAMKQSRPRRTRTPPPPRTSALQRDPLGEVLSKLSSRLDLLTGQAEDLQRRRSQSEHVGEGASTSRSQLIRSRQRLSSSLQRHDSEHKSRVGQQQAQQKRSAAAASPRSPRASRPDSSRRDDDTLSSKWNHLLDRFGRP